MNRAGLRSCLALACCAGALAIAGCGSAPLQPREAAGRHAVGLWGDLPYSPLQARTGVPNLVADMNAGGLAFSVHVGDIKQGSGSACDDKLYRDALAMFDSLDEPAMYTPGDNEWTDCDRASNGGFSSRERLDHLRAVFFARASSLGGRKRMAQEVQSQPLCLGAAGRGVPCVENRRWMVDRVTYVTLNVPGSCNNLCDEAPDRAEWEARNRANIQWLRDSFRIARERRSVAIMLLSQADPGWDESDGTRAIRRNPRTLVQTDGQPDGYGDYLRALRQEVVAFGRPVAYVHGDSHYFRIDKPLLDEQGRRLENFTRVEVFGDNAEHGNNDAHWLKVHVDPGSREVFSYEPKMVPGNRVAVPAP